MSRGARPGYPGEDEQAGRDAGRAEDDQPRVGLVDAEDTPAEQFAEDEQLSAMEVTSAQFIVLATLSMGEAKSASDLCKGISYDAGAMTRMIDRLEEKGLLRRSRPFLPSM